MCIRDSARTLRHEWNEAKLRIQVPNQGAHLVRIGIQNDLATQFIGKWVSGFRRAFRDTTFYIEPDSSNQMCADLLTGSLDFAVMFALSLIHISMCIRDRSSPSRATAISATMRPLASAK